MQQTDLAYTPAYRLRELMDAHQVSPVEVTEVFLRRIESLDAKLHSYLTVTGDEAMASARAAEESIGRGEAAGPLLGIPVSIKDLEVSKGVRTTLGSKVFNETVPDYDSAVVERVRRAGAVILGKTNTPEFGLSGTTENRLGEACRNPWNTDRTSGGSSGGAGAALAAGLCPIAAGSDGGGSIRIPSSFCGVYGIKPTLGRVPRVGGFGRPAPNLTSQSGPMARNVRDAATLLQVMAGRDSRDPISLRETPPDFVGALDQGVRGLRLAWSADLGYAAVDPGVAGVAHAAAKVFEELGCNVDEPGVALEHPLPAFLDIFCAGAFTSYGYLLEGQGQDLTDYARRSIEHGQRVSGADYARALKFVEVMKAQLDDLMERYDLLLTPTMAVPAFAIGQHPTKIGGKDVDPWWGYLPFTPPFNVSGQPAASVPCGFSQDGMPIGLHIVGRRGEETTVLRASAAFEEARPWDGQYPSEF